MNEWLQSESEIISRSELERYRTCPRQGQLMHGAGWENKPMVVGQMAHEAISLAMRDMFTDVFPWGPKALREAMTGYAEQSREDYRDDVIEAVKYASYTLVNYVSALSIGKVLAFDGGQGDKTGQYAQQVEVGDHKLTVAGEVDLLHTTASEVEYAITDYKTGWSLWTPAQVRESFQFRTYAWLVLSAYEDLEAVTVRVAMTRLSEGLTSPVRFIRERDYHRIEQEIVRACYGYLEHRDAELAPAFPDESKCGQCAVAHLCPDVNQFTVSEDPEGAVKRLIQLEAATKKLKGDLSSYCDKNGPIICDNQIYARVPTSRPTYKIKKVD